MKAQDLKLHFWYDLNYSGELIKAEYLGTLPTAAGNCFRFRSDRLQGYCIPESLLDLISGHKNMISTIELVKKN